MDKKIEAVTNQPFFARFLQNQAHEQFPQVQSAIQAGRKLPETMKYPSDRDEI
jgi:hypothetical protein